MLKILTSVLTVYGVWFCIYFFVWLWCRLAHFPERVTVATLTGRKVTADVVGASKLRLGEWQRTKVRLYTDAGEPSWEQGDGFEEMGVKRMEAIFLIRPPR